MARTLQTRKRSRPSSWGRPMKRRRMMRRRRGRRTRSMVGNTRPVPLGGFRRKRISKYKFRRMLWRDTQTRTKYKSYGVETGTIATPANNTSNTCAGFFAAGVYNHSYEPFYTPGGGMVALSQSIANITDPTETYATFDSDIIIRGGLLSFTVANNTETTDDAAGRTNDIVMAKILLIKTGPDWTTKKADFENNVLQYVSARGITKDEKTSLGYICLERDFQIKDGESCAVSYKVPCQKINVGDYSNENYTYLWYLVVSNMWGGAAQTCQHYKSWNISFCGDAST